MTATCPYGCNTPDHIRATDWCWSDFRCRNSVPLMTALDSAAHTAGPWHVKGTDLTAVIAVHEGPDDQTGHRYVDGRHEHVVFRAEGATIEEQIANARIGAASLDMLTSLKDIVRILEAVRYTAGLGTSQMERLERARSAIRLAESGERA